MTFSTLRFRDFTIGEGRAADRAFIQSAFPASNPTTKLRVSKKHSPPTASSAAVRSIRS